MPVDLSAPLAILIVFVLTVSLTAGGIAIGAESGRPPIVLFIHWLTAFVLWPFIACIGLYHELTNEVKYPQHPPSKMPNGNDK